LELEGALLTALQLGDSLFPSGAFAHSHGLESLVADRRVRGAAELQALLRVQLLGRLAGADLPALLAAHDAAARGDLEHVLRVDRALTAVKLAGEERAASRQVGRRLLAEALRLAPGNLSLSHLGAEAERGAVHGNAAVALGLASQALGLAAEPAALVCAYAFSAGLVSAAMRLARLGHGEAQAVLLQARPDVERSLDIARTVPWDELAPFAPQLDIACARHERLGARMFAS
jgi:urease accessory protein